MKKCNYNNYGDSTLKYSNISNFCNDEELVTLINSLIDVIKEHYKNIKKEIKEGKLIFEKENLIINKLSNIEIEINSFISKAKEIIQGIKILRKKQHLKERNLNLSSSKRNDREKNNIKLSLTKINNSIINNSLSSERNINNSQEKNKEIIKKYNLKYSKNSVIKESLNKIDLNNILNKRNYNIYRRNLPNHQFAFGESKSHHKFSVNEFSEENKIKNEKKILNNNKIKNEKKIRNKH